MAGHDALEALMLEYDGRYSAWSTGDKREAYRHASAHDKPVPMAEALHQTHFTPCATLGMISCCQQICLTSAPICHRQSMVLEHISSTHGAQAGALATALARAGQKPGSTSAADESIPASGADASATLGRMHSSDPSLPAVKPGAAVKLLRSARCSLLQCSLQIGEHCAVSVRAELVSPVAEPAEVNKELCSHCHNQVPQVTWSWPCRDLAEDDSCPIHSRGMAGLQDKLFTVNFKQGLSALRQRHIEAIVRSRFGLAGNLLYCFI